jgi:aldehyde:ferredoxin oxidoreductase
MGSRDFRKILHVDLASRSSKLIEVPGQSLVPISLLLANYYASDTQFTEKKSADFLVIGRGVLSGNPGVGLAVATFTGISPQSGKLIEAKVEGRLASRLRSLELDCIVLFGRAQSLTGLRIEKSPSGIEVKFEDSSHLVGASVWETMKQTKKKNETLVAIGKAGEDEKVCASVVCDFGFPTQTGGVGAILGRLKIKYMALEDLPQVPAGRMSKQISYEYLSGIKAGNILSKYHFDPPGFGIFVSSTLSGYLAGGNFATRLPKITETFTPDDFTAKVLETDESCCPGCVQNCLKIIGAESDLNTDGYRVHQLGITAFASQWGDCDSERALRFNSYCHEIGVEHLYVSALLTQENPNHEQSVEAIVDEVINKALNNQAYTVKSMPLPPFDPRGNQGLGLAMALNPTGPRYDVIEHDLDFDPNWSWNRHNIFGEEFGIPEGGLPIATLDSRRFPAIVEIWKLWSALDALGVCIFASPPTRDLRLSHIYSLSDEIVGVELDRDSLFSLGLTRLCLQRLLNGALGAKASEDDLPEYFFTNPIDADLKGADASIFGNEDTSNILNSDLYSAALSRSDFLEARSHIYTEFGWSEDRYIDRTHPIAKVALELQQQFNSAIEKLAI